MTPMGPIAVETISILTYSATFAAIAGGAFVRFVSSSSRRNQNDIAL